MNYPTLIRAPWDRIIALCICGAAIYFVIVQLPTLRFNDDYTLVVIAWMLAFAAYLFAIAPATLAHRDRDRWWRTHRATAVILGAITLAGFFLRVWQIGSIPFTLSGDEAAFGLDALHIIRGEIGTPFATSWMSQPTMSFFYGGLAMRFCGATQTALRLPWAVIGALSVPITFWMVARLKGAAFGLITATLLATYHYHIHFSRLSVNNIAATFWMGLAILFFFRARGGNRPLDWLWLGAACGGALYFYQGARLTPLVILGTIFYLTIYDRGFWRARRRGLLIALGAFLIVAAPMLQFAVRFPDDFNARANQIGMLYTGAIVDIARQRGASIATVLFDQFRHAALAFNSYSDRTAWYGLGQPLLDPIFGTLFLLGLGYGTIRAVMPRADRRIFPIVAWWWSGMILGGMMTESPPTTSRLITLSVPVCFFIALALMQIVRLAKRAIAGLPARAVLISAVLFFALISLKTYFVDYTPRFIFGGDHAQAATRLAPRVNEMAQTHRFYFIGAPFMYAGFATIPFLAPTVNITDIAQPLDASRATDWRAGARGIVFIFAAERIAELAHAQNLFPQGRIEEIRAPIDNRMITTLFIVPPISNE
ncbi:MAG: glycosyltransferase family 39 protein [Chloroflexi bacterium]|nr:glycosyltransferase family 39 protein [Chloroflexota bacterium]